MSDLRIIESLDTNENANVIFRGIVGSRAYGTANENSDIDIRGVFTIHPFEYVSLLQPPMQVNDSKNDKAYYSLLRFCELSSEANPTTLEMLFLPEDCVLKRTRVWDELVKNRNLFITQRAIDSHLGYAVSQIKKARGCNKRVWNPWPETPPKPEDYCTILLDVRNNPIPMLESNVDLSNCKVAPISKNINSEILAVYDFGEPTGGVFRNGNLVCFDIPKSDLEKRVGVLFFNRQAFEQAKKHHKEYWNWRKHRNEARWVQQEKGELDFDAKNMMHLMRLLFSGENIVSNGEPIIRFSGDKLKMLLSIRKGEWTFDQIMDKAKLIQTEIESKRGNLPEACDKLRVDKLIQNLMKELGY